MQTIQFNNTGYEPFFDYIKAYAIICVLIGHTISMVDNWASGLWVSMQVPLFVLVQSFHSLKKTAVKLNWSKLLWRIIVPYFMVQIAIFSLLGIYGGFDNLLIAKFVHGGGTDRGHIFRGFIFR